MGLLIFLALVITVSLTMIITALARLLTDFIVERWP